jgi:hypothetical protein
MAAAQTYEPIATQTAGGSTTVITFTSIPSTYTDLVFVMTGSSGNDINCRFNNDSGANYGLIRMFTSGDGSIGVGTGTGQTSFDVTIGGLTNGVTVGNIMNYANTSMYKTTLYRPNNTGGAYVSYYVSNWNSNSAVNRIDFTSQSGNISSGVMFTIYGIKAA